MDTEVLVDNRIEDGRKLVAALVLQTVAGLMNRTGALQPSIITLHDGSAIQAVPVGIDMRSPGTVQIVLQDVSAGTSVRVSADDVANIQ